MKNHFRPVALVLALTLIVTASLFSQTTYDLPSGQSLMVINQLPETFSQHFNDEVLVDRLGELPEADYRAIVAPGPDGLSLGLMLPSFDPEQFDEFFTIESSRGVNMLDIELVVEYGTALWAWINTAQRTAPSDVSQAFRSVDWNAYILFQKADEMVTFQGFLDNSGGRWGFRMGMRQPITYASESLGEHQIYTEGYEDVMLRYQETYDYPLPLPKTPEGTITMASFVYTFLGIPID
tara:strand:- start:1171 stop:1881 length:711 start_codon:yes stop_codon:yes gene_type:complete